MEFVRDTDKAFNGYKYYIDIQDQISAKDAKIYISRLSVPQKKELDKYKTLLRQRKFSSQGNNKDVYNARRQEHITYLRATEPEIMAEQNRKDVRNHRLRNKEKEEQLRQKLRELEGKATITDAIRARKARAQMKELKELKEMKENKSIVSDILNNIIDTIPKKAQQKRNKEAVQRHKAKKEAGQPTKTYNTRSRAKK